MVGKEWRYKPDMVEKVRQLGEHGLTVTQAAAALGVSVGAYRHWEKTKPEFREAARGVRRNTNDYADRRMIRLREKSEEQLLKILEQVRADKKRLIQAYENRTAEQRGNFRPRRKPGDPELEAWKARNLARLEKRQQAEAGRMAREAGEEVKASTSRKQTQEGRAHQKSVEIVVTTIPFSSIKKHPERN